MKREVIFGSFLVALLLVSVFFINMGISSTLLEQKNGWSFNTSTRDTSPRALVGSDTGYRLTSGQTLSVSWNGTPTGMGDTTSMRFYLLNSAQIGGWRWVITGFGQYEQTNSSYLIKLDSWGTTVSYAVNSTDTYYVILVCEGVYNPIEFFPEISVTSYVANVFSSPSVSISPSSSVTIDRGQSQLFTSTVSGGTSPYTYQWYLDGVAVSGATSFTWTSTPGSAGIFSVYVNVRDSAGFTVSSAPTIYYVNMPPSVSISPASVVMDVGQSQPFTSSVSYGTPPYSYQWYLNGAQINGANSSSWVFTPQSQGSYIQIYAKVTDNVGVQATSNTATVTVNNPFVSISPSSVVMNVGQSQSFASSVSGGTSPYAYQWYLNGVPVSGATSNSWTFTPTSSGSYTVYLNVNDSVSEIAISNTATVTVQAPTYNVTISAHCNTESLNVGVGITEDGSATGYNTPYTFSGLSGSHTFTVPSADASGHPFLQWSTNQTSTTITCAGGGTYTAYYQAAAPQTYNVTINAHCNTDGVDVSMPIALDGSSSGHSTAYTFTGLTGSHNFTVPNIDVNGHPFLSWNTGQTYTTITVSSGGTYTAYYQALTYVVTINAHCNTEGLNVSVPITEDGSSTGVTTPHTFAVLTGNHTFTVPSTDNAGHPFLQWNTNQTSATITVSSGGAYIAYYQTHTLVLSTDWNPSRDSYSQTNFGSTWSAGGNCYGLSCTEILYFMNNVLGNTVYPYLPAQQTPATSTSDLNLPTNTATLNNASLAVMFHQVYDPNRFFYFSPSESAEYNKLVGTLQSGVPAALAMYNTRTGWCHAIVAYGIEMLPDGTVNIKVSDPNVPQQENIANYNASNQTFLYSAAGLTFNEFEVITPQVISTFWSASWWYESTQFQSWVQNWLDYSVTGYNIVVADKNVNIESNGRVDKFMQMGNSQTFVKAIPGSSGIEEGNVQVYAIPAGTPFTIIDPGSNQSTILITRVDNESGQLLGYGNLLIASTTQGSLNFTATPSSVGLSINAGDNALNASATCFSATLQGCSVSDVLTTQIDAGQNFNLTAPCVASFTASKTVVGQGYSVRIDVTITNVGNNPQNVTLTLSANTTTLDSEVLFNLLNGTPADLVYEENTSSFAYGNYALSAYCEPNGINYASSNFTYTGVVTVTIPGDVNGDFKVGLPDLVLLAQAYGSKLGNSNWNPNADIDGNNAVGLSDLVILAQHYGQHYP